MHQHSCENVGEKGKEGIFPIMQMSVSEEMTNPNRKPHNNTSMTQWRHAMHFSKHSSCVVMFCLTSECKVHNRSHVDRVPFSLHQLHVLDNVGGRTSAGQIKPGRHSAQSLDTRSGACSGSDH